MSKKGTQNIVDDIINLSIENLIIVKPKVSKQSQKKSNDLFEKESYIPLSKSNQKITITLKNVIIPFGVENYNGKNIINLELNTKKSNKTYNAYATIATFEESLNLLHDNKNIINEFKESITGKSYYPNMRQSKDGYIIRSHIFGQPKISTNFLGQLMSATLNDIKKTFANVVLELGSIWVTDNNYGINWYVREIEILCSF